MKIRLSLVCLAVAIGLTALDNDPEAVAVCADNAALNGVAFDVLCGTFAATRHIPDLIVANLQMDVLIAAKPEFAGRTRPGATVLLCGILDEQVRDLRATYEPDFELLRVCLQDEWVAMIYRRR